MFEQDLLLCCSCTT